MKVLTLKLLVASLSAALLAGCPNDQSSADGKTTMTPTAVEYVDGQLCITLQVSSETTQNLKRLEFEMFLPKGSVWPASQKTSSVDAPWAITGGSKVISQEGSGPDNGVSVAVELLFDDDMSNGVPVERGTYTVTAKFPFKLPPNGGLVWIQSIAVKSEDGRSLFNVPRKDFVLPGAASESVVDLVGGGSFAWTPDTGSFVPVLRISATGTSTQGTDVSCTSFDMWNTSERLSDMGVCRVDLVEGANLTMLTLGSADYLLKEFMFSSPLALTSTATVIEISCRASMNFSGRLSMAMNLNCDSENYRPFIPADPSNAALVLPTATGTTITQISKQTPFTDEFVPVPGLVFAQTETLLVDVNADSNPDASGGLSWRILVDDLQVDKGGVFCEPAGSGALCNFTVDPLVDGHGYLLNLEGRVVTLIVADGEVMLFEFDRKTLDFSGEPELPDGYE